MPADVQPVQGDDPHALLIGGGVVVVSRSARFLPDRCTGGEAVLHAQLDLRERALARTRLGAQ